MVSNGTSHRSQEYLTKNWLSGRYENWLLLVQLQKSGELIILLSLVLKTWKIWVIYLSHEIC
jgi:hypothetical protein